MILITSSGSIHGKRLESKVQLVAFIPLRYRVIRKFATNRAVCMKNQFTIYNSIFHDINSMDNGGAIYTDTRILVINLCIFDKCKSTKSGGSLYCCNSRDLSIISTVFQFSHADMDSGAILVRNTEKFDILFTNISNSVSYKSGIFNPIGNKDGNFKRCIICYCSVENNGIIYTDSGYIGIEHNNFHHSTHTIMLYGCLKSEIKLDNTYFGKNKIHSIYFDGSSMMVKECKFSHSLEEEIIDPNNKIMIQDTSFNTKFNIDIPCVYTINQAFFVNWTTVDVPYFNVIVISYLVLFILIMFLNYKLLDIIIKHRKPEKYIRVFNALHQNSDLLLDDSSLPPNLNGLIR